MTKPREYVRNCLSDAISRMCDATKNTARLLDGCQTMDAGALAEQLREQNDQLRGIRGLMRAAIENAERIEEGI